MAARTYIVRGEAFRYEFTFKQEHYDLIEGDDLVVRFGQLGEDASFESTPDQDGDNELLWTGTVSAAETAAIEEDVIYIAVWDVESGSETRLGQRSVRVYDSVE